MAGVLQAVVEAGEIEATDAASVARQILGMIDGLNAQARVRWDGVNDRGTHLARAVEGMVGAVRCGSSVLPSADALLPQPPSASLGGLHAIAVESAVHREMLENHVRQSRCSV